MVTVFYGLFYETVNVKISDFRRVCGSTSVCRLSLMESKKKGKGKKIED
jgi:hypothetical protein